MGWTIPRTWVVGEIPTASMMNTHIRDNLLDLDARSATAISNNVDTSQTTTSTAATDLGTVGPSITLVTGTTAIIAVSARCINTSGFCVAGYAISGATTRALHPRTSVITGPNVEVSVSKVSRADALNPGSNTFTMKYYVTAGTGTFSDRVIAGWPGNKLS